MLSDKSQHKRSPTTWLLLSDTGEGGCGVRVWGEEREDYTEAWRSSCVDRNILS